MMKWILLEPFHGGSHRHLVDGLAERLLFEVEVWTQPARHWKWRMHGAALHFAERWWNERPRASGILASSLLDAAALRGLLPEEAATLPLVLYFHENQLRYPVRERDERDDHYAWINLQSALAADRVLWNSAFNRDSFLGELPGLVGRLPDFRPVRAAERIAARSSVLPVPVDASGIARRSQDAGPRSGPCRILWSHRWEHDKAPEVFFGALETLAEEGLPFEVAVLGERFDEVPEAFARARESLGERIVAWGYREDRPAYEAELARADVAVSTARHEFQGLAILEAAAAGAVPLVPDDLVYPEIWPAGYRYPRGALAAALRDRVMNLERWRAEDPRGHALRHDWEALLDSWVEVFQTVARGDREPPGPGPAHDAPGDTES